MEHLRIVPDWLWHAANEAITGRNLCAPRPRGRDHRLAGIPRNSRGPLSGLFFCGVCHTGKMHMDGRNGGGYRCGNARKGRCWNKATASRDVVHEHIGRALRERLLSLEGVVDNLLEEIPRRLRDEGPLQEMLVDLQSQEAQLLAARQRLLEAIEQAKGAVEVLVARLLEREEDLDRGRGEMARVKVQLAHRAALPTRVELLDAIAEVADRVPRMDRETGALLRHLLNPIRAVPYQQFGGDLVVLRAHFELRPIGLLPAPWRVLFPGTSSGTISGPMDTPVAHGGSVPAVREAGALRPSSGVGSGWRDAGRNWS
jgi:hypothetical protein